MQEIRTTAIARLALLAAAAATFVHSGVALSSETPEAQRPASAVLCEEAIVNPVSGYAECVRPLGAAVDPPPPRPPVVKLAVFDFEMEDVSPAASLLGQTTDNQAIMEKVTSEARRVLAESGRFIIIKARSPRNCDGCEAGIALQVGAEQALIGVVRKVTQTDYYVLVQISDAQTGKVVNQQEANFAGGPEGWASGVRMLIKHQVLVPADEP